MKSSVKILLKIILLFVVLSFSGFSFSQTYRILFDNSKAQTAANADWKIDDNEPFPDPANPTSESDWIGGISSWGFELWQTGDYEIVQLPQGSTITYGDASNPLDLSNFNVFVCVEPNIQFTDSEKEAIISFVENGGGLFVVADHSGSDRNSDGWDSPNIWNDLFNNNPRGITNIFGVIFNLNSISGSYTDVRTNLSEPEDDALFNGPFGNVTAISYNAGASMTVDQNANPSARGQIWTDSYRSDSGVVVATSRFGNGRIALIGDSSPCDDGTGEPGDTLYDGWNEAGVTNREIFLNLTVWLAQGGGIGTGISIGSPIIDPSSPQNNDLVTVSVDVADSNGTITSVLLEWKAFNSDVFNSVNMTNVSGNTYTGQIPANSDTLIQYKIIATDNDGNVGSKGLYSYQVGYIPICDLRNNANDVDGVNKYNNLNVKLSGIVTVPTLNGFASAGKTEIYIQDFSGCGINIYNPVSDQPQVSLGDVVEVYGKLTQYNGKLEIDISSGTMTVIGTDVVPAPEVITCSQIGEANEGKLVRINNVHIVSGSIPASGVSDSLVIEDSTGQATIYIDRDTDIDGMETPSGDFDIAGIVSQYDTSLPYTSGYQLMPRSQSDFILSGSNVSGKDLYFSEYIEGSGYNKALEIFNETGSSVDLSEYEIQMYVNGSTTPSVTIPLSGTLNDGETFVICHTSADSALQSLSQMTSGSLTFNGDDAILLLHNGVVIDSIGRVGEDPGSSWSNNGVSTQDMTLVRKPHIHQGDITIDDAFDPSVEWDGYEQDTFDNVGTHTSLYTLHVEVAEGNGTTNPYGDNDYQYNSQVSINAIPDNGYEFVGWSGYLNANDNPVTVTMSQDISLYAHFTQSSGTSGERVYFSEYIEGSGNNKAIEIYNESGNDIDLSEYTIEIYNNGNSTPNQTIALSGTLVDGSAFVIAYGGASQELLDLADFATYSLSYNGDDAIVLKHNGIIIDCIGQVGFDPGEKWENNGVSTQDMTLRRKPHIHTGDTDETDAFDPSVEWETYPQDTFDDLGQHNCLYYLTVYVLSGNGSVNPAGTVEYQYKTSVNILATPDVGYVFDHWEGDFTINDNPFTFTIRNDTQLGAVFVSETNNILKDLYFSEYIEGSSYNKALEIFNETGSSVDLSEYEIQMYVNGSTTPSVTIPLAGTLNDGETFVICHTSADSALQSLSQMTSGSLTFNGDDAILLLHNGVVIDSIGRVGEDPGSSWSNNGVSTQDMTLVRKPHIHQGDITIDDAFDPSVEWDGYEQDTFDYVGAHASLYTLTVNVLAGSGTTSPSGSNDYQYNTVVNVTATPASGYQFDGWNGYINSTDNPISVTMTENITLNVSFSASGGGGGGDLYFSEYIEGSGNNKAFEIFNETGSAVDLSEYSVEIYNNGNSTPNHTINLSGTLNDGSTYVIVYNLADVSLLAYGDLITAECSFNGNDAIVLKHSGVIIDCIGRIGEDPGSSWSNNGVSTQDMTLRRKPDIHQGDSDATDAFDPSIEWDGYPQDSFDNLGTGSGSYTLTVGVSGDNGSVNPSGSNLYVYGNNVQITATPASGYQFDHWEGDASGNSNPLTVTVRSDMTVNAVFTAGTFIITATAGAGGTISPSGSISVSGGSDITFTIVPNTGYHISDVLVDGSSVGAVNSYTFTNVTHNHTIEAQFEIDTFTITASAGQGGTINPSGSVQVAAGSDKTFAFIPDSGYHIDDVIIDGLSIGRRSFYTFRNIKSDHTISVTFAENHPPMIRTIDFGQIAGNAPFTFNASVDAYDPDGGDIVRYEWEISGKRNYTIVTSSLYFTHTFAVPGEYFVSVRVFDDEEEFAVSDIITINVSEYSSIVIPLPTLFGISKLKSDVTDISTTVVNIFNESVNLTIDAIDANGETVEEKNITVNPFGTFKVSELSFESDFSRLKASADKYVVLYTTIKGDNFETESYISSKLKGILYIPHISEEVEYWTTLGYISNPNGYSTITNIAQNNYDSGDSFSFFLDFESMLTGNIEVRTNWGTVICVTDNPFVNSNALSGFELFIKDGYDGAAVEMNNIPAYTLYIPHIPEETEQFWTGLVLDNVEEETAHITFDFYSSDGEFLGNKVLELDAGSKFKTLMKDIIPESISKPVCWAIVKSDKNLVGVELFGTYNNAICGYSLGEKPQSWGVIPEIKSGENYWTGIGIVNPNSEETLVTLTLRDRNGNVKEQKSITISAMSRFKAVVDDIFDNAIVEIGDTITYTSSKPIVGLKVSGDIEGKVMKALSFVR